MSLAKYATGGRSEQPFNVVRADLPTGIVTIHALREFKSSSYRALLDELSQMGSGVEKMDREPGELPDFNTVCARYQELNMAV